MRSRDRKGDGDSARLSLVITVCGVALIGTVIVASHSSHARHEVAAATSEAVTSSSAPSFGIDATRIERNPTQVAAPFNSPVSVARASAVAACSFDWHHTVHQHIAAFSRFSTPERRQELQHPAPVDESNWYGIQADHETGSCTVARAAVVAGAPNTAHTRYVRVVLTQRVTSPRAAATATVLTTYRLKEQADGRWLVAGEVDGGG